MTPLDELMSNQRRFARYDVNLPLIFLRRPKNDYAILCVNSDHWTEEVQHAIKVAHNNLDAVVYQVQLKSPGAARVFRDMSDILAFITSQIQNYLFTGSMQTDHMIDLKAQEMRRIEAQYAQREQTPQVLLMRKHIDTIFQMYNTQRQIVAGSSPRVFKAIDFRVDLEFFKTLPQRINQPDQLISKTLMHVANWIYLLGSITNKIQDENDIYDRPYAWDKHKVNLSAGGFAVFDSGVYEPNERLLVHFLMDEYRCHSLCRCVNTIPLPNQNKILLENLDMPLRDQEEIILYIQREELKNAMQSLSA